MNTPINNTSIKNKHNKNSFIKYFIEFQLIKTQIGINKPVKTKKREMTPKQKEAFEAMVEKKKDIDRIKTEHTNAVKAQKQAILKEKEIKTKQIQQKLSSYKTDDEEIEEGTKKPKPRKKAVKKIIYEDPSSSSDDEIIVVRPKKSKKKKKKVILQESSSEEEEIQKAPKPARNNLNQNVDRTAQDQLKFDLQSERIHSAMRSLGFI